MTRKASGRSALILAAGLVLCLTGPLRAVESPAGNAAAEQAEESAGKPIALSKFSKARKRGKVAIKQRKSRGVLARGYRRKPADSKTLEATVEDIRANDDKALDDKAMPVADASQALPDSVANANAQWPAPNAGAQQPTAVAPVMPSPNMPSSNMPLPNMVPSDQLNDVDKTLSETPVVPEPVASPPARIAQVASDQRAPPSQDKLMSAMASADDQQQSVSSSDSAWGQSSTIGKIFIAMGGLLTFASAIRMFMA